MSAAIHRVYKRIITTVVPYRICRFYPTCSEYTMQAISKYGFWKGSLLGVKRFGRCHPFHHGGFDPVP